ELDRFLAKADATPLENVQALIVPHAGYRYSGPVAAYGYKEVAGKHYSRVIVMGPSHHLRMQNVANVPDVTHYATPLGETTLDTDFIAALKKHPEFSTIRGADDTEHSVQIQLPFLQKTLTDFKFIPIVVGQLDKDTAQSMARILAGLIDPETLVIASSDFTHYGSNYDYVPFKDNVFDNLKKLNMAAWDCIQRKDVGAFEKHLETTGDTICGQCPIRVLLSMLPGDSAPHLLQYDTSGHMMNDTTNSVSYFAIAFSGAWKKGEPVETTSAPTATLTDDEKAQLLTLARTTLECRIKNGRTPTSEELGITITPGMKQVMGAFVTLKENGQLRGCIGEIVPRRELYKAVSERAVDSGLNDHRFETYLAAGTKTVTVNDVPPTIAVSGAASAQEGTTYTVFEAIVFHEKE
ncbi:MAG: AmmeMemoRadiSam system protein B, partial [Candidatus Hydrogenedentes bacterium]|nr:AmmeMemoRadiSam system protein B [Candidatus Hydrogenedentota bacterium]